MRRAKTEIPLVPVLHAQQQRAVLLPAPGFLPQLGGLHRRHQQFECPGPVHLLAHDGFDLAQYPQAQGHPGEEPRRKAADQAGPEHELVTDDFCFRRHFLERRQRKLGKSHYGFCLVFMTRAFYPVLS